MKRLSSLLFLLPPLCLAACSVQEKNGQTNVEAPPILVHSNWAITQRATSTSGEKICTMTAGDVDVTLHSYSDHIAQQVALRTEIDESSYYTINVNGHSYETKGELFSASDAPAIINDFLTGQVAYTELSELGGPFYNKMRRYSNKLPLDSFPKLYQDCQRFIALKK